MKRYTLKFLSGCLLAFLASTSQVVYAQEANFSPVSPNFPISSSSFRIRLQELFRMHGTGLSQAVRAAVSNASPAVIQAGKTRLLRNAEQIGDLFGSIYGPQVGENVAGLFKQHVLIGSDYINAIKANQYMQAQQILEQWIAQGRGIARYLGRLDPALSHQVIRGLLDEHIMMESRLTVAAFQGNNTLFSQLNQQSLAQLAQMANYLAGVTDRFSRPGITSGGVRGINSNMNSRFQALESE